MVGIIPDCGCGSLGSPGVEEQVPGARGRVPRDGTSQEVNRKTSLWNTKLSVLLRTKEKKKENFTTNCSKSQMQIMMKKFKQKIKM